MNKKKFPLQLKDCVNNMFIVGKLERKENWKRDRIHTSIFPFTTYFQISNIPFAASHIQKVVWNFNDCKTTPFVVSEKSYGATKHQFKINYFETFTVHASVYTPKDIFTTASFIISSTNVKIKKNYINPEVFKDEIVDYYITGNFSDKLATSIQLIANRLAFAPNFINYTYREDMIGDAIVKMVKAVREEKFQPKKGNPFSYFTKIAFHAFCNRIKKEKKEKDTVMAYQEDIFTTLVESGFIPHPKGNNQIEEGDSIETY